MCGLFPQSRSISDFLKGDSKGAIGVASHIRRVHNLPQRRFAGVGISGCLHVFERQWSGRFPVDVSKTIISGQLSGHDHASGPFHHSRVSGERYHRSSCELGRFGIA